MSIQRDTTVIDLMLSLQMLLVQEEVIRMGSNPTVNILKRGQLYSSVYQVGSQPPVVRTVVVQGWRESQERSLSPEWSATREPLSPSLTALTHLHVERLAWCSQKPTLWNSTPASHATCTDGSLERVEQQAGSALQKHGRFVDEHITALHCTLHC